MSYGVLLLEREASWSAAPRAVHFLSVLFLALYSFSLITLHKNFHPTHTSYSGKSTVTRPTYSINCDSFARFFFSSSLSVPLLARCGI